MKKVAIIMAGGSGRRFWPLSRRHRPKQLLSIGNHPVMLQATIDRLRTFLPSQNILVVTGADQVDRVKQKCHELPSENIIPEPQPRDTAPCVGMGALLVQERFGNDSIIGTFPADHRFEDDEKFKEVGENTYNICSELQEILTWGIQPSKPSTGYGYIRYEMNTSRAFEGATVFSVEEFTEKPNRKRAIQLIEEQGALWNSGIFFWPTDFILEEIKNYMPDLHKGLQTIRQEYENSNSWSKAMEKKYKKLPATSIDYGVLEKTNHAWTMPVEMNWTDLGSWNELDKLIESDRSNNIVSGDVLTHDTKDSILYNHDGPLIGTVGLDEFIVVSTEDAVLICPKNQSEDVKKLVNKLQNKDRDEVL